MTALRHWRCRAVRLLALIGCASEPLAATQAANLRRTAITRGSYVETIVVKRPQRPADQCARSTTATTNRLPPPAWLYYGYPHSGDDTRHRPARTSHDWSASSETAADAARRSVSRSRCC